MHKPLMAYAEMLGFTLLSSSDKYLMNKLFDFYTYSLMNFFNSPGSRINTVGYEAARISFFFTIPILLNLLTIEGFALGLFNYELFPEFWHLFLIIVAIFFMIDRHATKFIMTRTYSGKPPKFATEILVTYLIATVILLFVSFISIP